jgi:hypothetical protein
MEEQHEKHEKVAFSPFGSADGRRYDGYGILRR